MYMYCPTCGRTRYWNGNTYNNFFLVITVNKLKAWYAIGQAAGLDVLA